MPKIWIYLAKIFLKIFALSLSTFITLLIVIRTQQIAKFAASSHALKATLLFILYQLPYILPFAIPLSLLMAGFTLSKELSSQGELTTIRSSGASLIKIYTPIYLLLFLISLGNFIIISELSPYSKKASKELVLQAFKKVSKQTLLNTFFLKDFGIIATANPKGSGYLYCYLPSSKQELTLALVEKMNLDNQIFKASDVAMIFQTKNLDSSSLTVETINNLTMDLENFELKEKKRVELCFEDLQAKQCLIALKIYGSCNKGHFELLKRFFFFLAPISFGILGLCFGIQQGRFSRSNYLGLSLLSLVLLGSYFIGKSQDHRPIIAGILFFIPQLFVISLSLWRQKAIESGVES